MNIKTNNEGVKLISKVITTEHVYIYIVQERVNLIKVLVALDALNGVVYQLML